MSIAFHLLIHFILAYAQKCVGLMMYDSGIYLTSFPLLYNIIFGIILYHFLNILMLLLMTGFSLLRI